MDPPYYTHPAVLASRFFLVTLRFLCSCCATMFLVSPYSVFDVNVCSIVGAGAGTCAVVGAGAGTCAVVGAGAGTCTVVGSSVMFNGRPVLPRGFAVTASGCVADVDVDRTELT